MKHMIEFAPSIHATALTVDADIDVTWAVEQLDVPDYRAAIIIHSGAGLMEEAYLAKLSQLFIHGVARFAEDYQVLVGDGATDVGGMKLIGEARHTIDGTFPLVGVTITRIVTYPGGPAPSDERWPLNRYHTHFLLVKSDDFGAESAALVGLATARPVPHVALVVNGGALVEQEVSMHAMRKTPLIALKGSGRFADRLATSRPDDYPDDTPVHVFDTNSQTPQELYELLRCLLPIHRETQRPAP